MFSEGPQNVLTPLRLNHVTLFLLIVVQCSEIEHDFILNTINCFVLIPGVIPNIFNFHLFLIQGEVGAGWTNTAAARSRRR
jgi:hypothetical protein